MVDTENTNLPNTAELTDAKLSAIVLHFALREKKFMLELSKNIKPEYLEDKFQLFYDIINKNFKDPRIREVISADAVSDYLITNGLAEHADKYKKLYLKLQSLTNGDGLPFPDSDFGYYLKKIKERYNRVVVESTAKKINEIIDSGGSAEQLNDIITSTVQDINAINKLEVFDEGDIGSDAANMFAEYEAIEQQPDFYKGILVGFNSLDERTNGFQGGELIIVAGMEGTGKSALMMNFAINAWLGSNSPTKAGYIPDGHNVLYFSLEMPRSNRGEFTSGAYLNKRVLSAVSELPFEQIRKGQLDPDNKLKLRETCNFIETYSKYNKFYIVDIPRGATMQDIESKFLEIKENIEIDLVVIDYIGIMAGAEKDDSDWQAQGNIAAEMHEFARIYNIPTMTAVQLNRPPSNVSLTKGNEKMNNTRISRSAMITQNANIVLAIGCRDNEEQFPDMPIYITKMRDGRKGPLLFTKALDRMRVYDGVQLTSNDKDDLSEFEDFNPNEDDE